jgi:hypothetical protein
MTLSTAVSHSSALVLAAGGLALLFVPQSIVAAIGAPPSTAIDLIVQLLGAAWLGLAGLNWLQRRAIIGGVFLRPLVFANTIHYVVAALVLWKAPQRHDSALVSIAAIAIGLLAVVYSALLMKGPFDRPR